MTLWKNNSINEILSGFPWKKGGNDENISLDFVIFVTVSKDNLINGILSGRRYAFW